MFRISLKSLWAHKRRLVGTSLAVVLGIAFLAGTMVLGDTLKATFNDLFTNVNRGTDAVVRSASEIKANGDTQRPPISATLVTTVRQVPGVAEAEPDINGYGVLVGRNGKPVTSNGPPTFAGNWLGSTSLNPYHLVEGRAPTTDNEVVIDLGLSKKAKLGVGDRTTAQLPEPVPVKIVGVAKFGTADSAAGSTFIGFTTHGAQQRILHSTSKINLVRTKASPGTSETAIAAEDSGDPADRHRGGDRRHRDQGTEGRHQQRLPRLLHHVPDRVRSDRPRRGVVQHLQHVHHHHGPADAASQPCFAPLGASRRQVLWSVLLETVLVGLVGAVIGLGLGLLVAIGLQNLFSAFGADLPTHALIVRPNTIVAGLVVGLVVTVLAGLLPAIRSSRVAPLAALRDVAFDTSSTSRVRLVSGAILTAGGFALVLLAATSSKTSLGQAGFGALLLIAGVVILGPVVASPASAVLGAPLARFRGITGTLARDNALRNPRRTASTASALLVGVAVVSLFTVLGASIKASVNESVDKSFAGDLVVSTGGGGGGGGRGFSPELATKLNQVPRDPESRRHRLRNRQGQRDGPGRFRRESVRSGRRPRPRCEAWRPRNTQPQRTRRL